MWRRVELEQVSRALKRRSAGGTQKLIVADLGEAPWEYVFEKARDERVRRKRHALGLVGARVRIMEGDATVREGLDLVIDGGIDRAQQVGPPEGGAHLRAKDRGERVARHENTRVRRRATGDNVVHHAAVRRQHPPRVRLDVRRARDADDVRQREHGTTR